MKIVCLFIGKHCWWCWSCPLLCRLRQLPNCSRNQATWRPFIKCALNICFSDVSRHAMKLSWNLFESLTSVLQSTNKPIQEFYLKGIHCKYLQLTYKSYLCPLPPQYLSTALLQCKFFGFYSSWQPIWHYTWKWNTSKTCTFDSQNIYIASNIPWFLLTFLEKLCLYMLLLQIFYSETKFK